MPGSQQAAQQHPLNGAGCQLILGAIPLHRGPSRRPPRVCALASKKPKKDGKGSSKRLKELPPVVYRFSDSGQTATVVDGDGAVSTITIVPKVGQLHARRRTTTGSA